MVVEKLKQTRLIQKSPRRPRRVMMHIVDAGGPEFDDGSFLVQLECNRCGFASEWITVQNVTEAMRGKPCPICNDKSAVPARPLFIPLKREFFEAFLAGEKSVEYRLYGDRWNHKVCRVGRYATLSLGYGTSNRVRAIVSKFRRERLYSLDEDVKQDLARCFDIDLEFGGSTPIACIHLEVNREN